MADNKQYFENPRIKKACDSLMEDVDKCTDLNEQAKCILKVIITFLNFAEGKNPYCAPSLKDLVLATTQASSFGVAFYHFDPLKMDEYKEYISNIRRYLVVKGYIKYTGEKVGYKDSIPVMEVNVMRLVLNSSPNYGKKEPQKEVVKKEPSWDMLTEQQREVLLAIASMSTQDEQGRLVFKSSMKAVCDIHSLKYPQACHARAFLSEKGFLNKIGRIYGSKIGVMEVILPKKDERFFVQDNKHSNVVQLHRRSCLSA